MTTRIALLGAGGKMGRRITNNIKDNPEYDIHYVEVSSAGIAALAEHGIEITQEEAALDGADIVVLAIPDRLIGPICGQIVPTVLIF